MKYLKRGIKKIDTHLVHHTDVQEYRSNNTHSIIVPAITYEVLTSTPLKPRQEYVEISTMSLVDLTYILVDGVLEPIFCWLTIECTSYLVENYWFCTRYLYSKR